MWDCGKNLIQGLWNGIKSAKDWVLDKIASIGNSIMKKSKEYLEYIVHQQNLLG